MQFGLSICKQIFGSLKTELFMTKIIRKLNINVSAYTGNLLFGISLLFIIFWVQLYLTKLTKASLRSEFTVPPLPLVCT